MSPTPALALQLGTAEKRGFHGSRSLAAPPGKPLWTPVRGGHLLKALGGGPGPWQGSPPPMPPLTLPLGLGGSRPPLSGADMVMIP